jgi:hypothetical protein
VPAVGDFVEVAVYDACGHPAMFVGGGAAACPVCECATLRARLAAAEAVVEAARAEVRRDRLPVIVRMPALVVALARYDAVAKPGGST